MHTVLCFVEEKFRATVAEKELVRAPLMSPRLESRSEDAHLSPPLLSLLPLPSGGRAAGDP